jgi:hypothetical protein
MNGGIFRAYIEQFAVPILKRNDIVAIDNLPAHNVAGIEETINAVGATLRYLPKYPTSTRSNCLTANSRRTCASLPHAPSPAYKHAGCCHMTGIRCNMSAKPPDPLSVRSACAC